MKARKILPFVSSSYLTNCRPSSNCRFHKSNFVNLFAKSWQILPAIFISNLIPLLGDKRSNLIMSSNLELSSPAFSPISASAIGNDEPLFSLRKFLSPPAEGNEASLFLSWLQNRLREHYFKIEEHRRRAVENQEFGPILSMEEVDVCFSELKLLEIEEESHWMKSHWISEESQPPTDDGCVVKGIQCKYDENLPYETGVRRFAVTFQKNGVHSPLQTLHMVLEVGEVHDVGLLGEIVPQFVATSEKHSIDVFSLVFPTLQGWIYSKNLKISLPIPTCYYAKYEENDKHLQEQVEQMAAPVMENTQNPKVVESHRILILSNVLQEGFKPKNAEGTSFLSLMNVTFGLKEIAKFHALSWAFAKSTQIPLQQHFPFLEMADFVPYFKSLLAVGYPTLVSSSEEYLNKHEVQDKDMILERMRFIGDTLVEIVSKLYPPNLTSHSPGNGPVTLLHHGLNYTTTMFRHNYQKLDEGVEIMDPSSPEAGTRSPPNMSIQRELTLVDWKCATYGPPMFDLAFFLLTSLPPKTRQRETTTLLKLYAEEFEATASLLGHAEDVTWNWDDLMENYEKGLLYGCLLISTNVTRDKGVKENDVEVFVEAMRDVISLKIV